MPWIAKHKGNLVTPEGVSARDSLTCPDCGENMHVRGPYTRSDGSFVARHFSHNPTDTIPPDTNANRQCSGETDEHKRMKSIVFSKLNHVFGDIIDTIEIEMPVGESEKFADVGVIFTDHVDNHNTIATTDCITGAVGDRIAIEVQYRNKSKDIQETTRIYAKHGYSVLWLYPKQFSKYDVEFFTGSGAVWKPIYPEVIQSDIGFPKIWDYHTAHVTLSDHSAEVEASFPVGWYETELKNYLAANGPETQYERWSRLFPDIGDEFVELAEEMLTNPKKKSQLLLDTLFPTMDPSVMTNYYGQKKLPLTEVVCGNCYWSKQDEYRDDDRALICWRNQPDDAENQPRKLTLTDEFAQECHYFSFDQYIKEDMKVS